MKSLLLVLTYVLAASISYAFNVYLNFDERNQIMECLIDDARLMLSDYVVTTELDEGTRETFCKNGYAEGISKIYYNNGTRFEFPYKSGRIEGVGRVYSASGSLEEEIPYKNGKKEGQGKMYYESGKLQQTTTYKNGSREGASKLYHENGALDREFTYKNNKREGLEKIYRNNGKPFFTMTYQNDKAVKGICHNAYGKNISLTNAELSNWNNGLTVRCY